MYGIGLNVQCRYRSDGFLLARHGRDILRVLRPRLWLSRLQNNNILKIMYGA